MNLIDIAGPGLERSRTRHDAAMPRIEPLDEDRAPAEARELAAAHLATGSRMTNMKWTAARAPAALEMLLTWYPLHDRVAGFLGERRTQLLCHAISAQNDCLICSTFFRRLLIDAGEDPDDLRLDELDELVVKLGRRLARDPHSVDDDLYGKVAEHYDDDQIVELVAFAAIMVATNVFNDVLQVPLDDYLGAYRREQA
jgi:alkylhydroperoxidase family enzyme